MGRLMWTRHKHCGWVCMHCGHHARQWMSREVHERRALRGLGCSDNGMTPNDGLGAGAEARCWCHTCRPITFADMRMVLCPTCGDKRCLHALSHAAPCAKTDLYAHNAWVERILLRSQRAPENSAPDEVGMTALGAWGAPNG